MIQAEFPAKAAPLFTPCAYKVMYGGRGGAKSWAAARALLTLALKRKLFILCAREIQKSITESVHKLLADQIGAMGLSSKFEVQSRTIICLTTGSRFVFAGVRNNITAIKSMEAVDVCWIEEAEKVSGNSWSVLLPTIRRDPPHGPFELGSEVWVVFNPELDSDFTYKYWVLDPPQPCFRFGLKGDNPTAEIKALNEAKPRTVMEMSHADNQWFPDELRLQMEDMKARNYEDYLTIFEGRVRRVVRGAIYAKELEKAQNDGRISPSVLVDRSKPVDIGVDLGRSDMTSIWFMQQVGMQHHAIDFYENCGFDWGHYIEQIQSRRYAIGRLYLPHDAANETIVGKSILRQTRDFYPNENQVRIVPRTKSVVNDINATRNMFGRLWINEKTCQGGLHSLSHYRYEVDDKDPKDISKEPLHDWSSHAADALRCYIMGMKSEARGREQAHIWTPAPISDRPGTGWMSL